MVGWMNDCMNEWIVGWMNGFMGEWMDARRSCCHGMNEPSDKSED